MRIVIDLQAAQASNRNRGIGRYSLALAKAMIRNKGEHDVIIVLSGLFPKTIMPIRRLFSDLLPPENICVWSSMNDVAFTSNNSDWRLQAALAVREGFLKSLKPDIVHITSLFEGYSDDAVTGVPVMKSSIPVAITLYDLIPLLHPECYLKPSSMKEWYLEKVEHLKKAQLLLSISDFSRNEALENLMLSEDKIVNISSDVDEHFTEVDVSLETKISLFDRIGLSRDFIMYTGGADHRKNIDGLIRAYASLSKDIKEQYQLAIVCSMSDTLKQSLLLLIDSLGLTRDDVVLTGFVSEEDLILLYNTCSLFVFPSWHEGFGMPALEAIRCGAAVIGSNITSLPEVIGWNEALFDPYDCNSMAELITKGLKDQDFRNQLLEHSREQSKKFSWDESARCAIKAMEKSVADYKSFVNEVVNQSESILPKLAYVSPMPPVKSGIADYSALLLPYLSSFYDIEVIVEKDKLKDNEKLSSFPLRSSEWFLEHANHYDRIVYHVGNSSYHQYILELLKLIPGVVVLHDFFLSNLLEYMEKAKHIRSIWSNELYFSHGYVGLIDLFDSKNSSSAVWKYPSNLSVIQSSEGVIVHARHSLELVRSWYSETPEDWQVIPLLRNAVIDVNRTEVRARLGLSSSDIVVCAFGLLGPTKLNHALIDAWLASSLSKRQDCRLIFVGENPKNEYGKKTLAKLDQQNISITGWVDAQSYKDYLLAADIGVQLRSLSRGETSASVLDCMSVGLATVVNENGSMKDLDSQSVWKLSDNFSTADLVEALETLVDDVVLRHDMGAKAKEVILTQHEPSVCAQRYFNAIEDFYRSRSSAISGVVDAIASIPFECKSDELREISCAVARSFPPRNRQRQLLVDISELVQRDSKTGIQRVVRSILIEWLKNPPMGFRVEPVFATPNKDGYFYARKFVLGFLSLPDDILCDEPVDFFAGDIFLGLDLQPSIVPVQRAAHETMRNYGVQVVFVVYDLLPVMLPHCFAPDAKQIHEQWLATICHYDGLVCISHSVANEVKSWLQNRSDVNDVDNLQIEWFHLGADTENSKASEGMPDNAKNLLGAVENSPSFLMVGTLEPRKGYLQTLLAFESLWQKKIDVNLIIVGKQGWMVEPLVNKITSHSEFNQRLFWFKDASDQFLDLIYSKCSCLIAASEGEGFGLPLIEAAQHKLPIIARDIPVFREVAREYAYYFDDTLDPVVLAESIIKWLELYECASQPKSDNLPYLTWKKSSQQLLDIIIKFKKGKNKQ